MNQSAAIERDLTVFQVQKKAMWFKGYEPGLRVALYVYHQSSRGKRGLSPWEHELRIFFSPELRATLDGDSTIKFWCQVQCFVQKFQVKSCSSEALEVSSFWNKSKRAEGFFILFLSQLFPPSLLFTFLKLLAGSRLQMESSSCLVGDNLQLLHLNFEKLLIQLENYLTITKMGAIAKGGRLGMGATW